ncbi:hypothetical protein OAN307_c41730 [Octadecabacter antarcticus 307]|uniref:Uncharacterized protein n=1 Tax=Octadecabacter antarcticus 307 TaxID=391626 RepID=M9RIB6_9RHOB|nr:hypothetical protein OAN307_c41730 [Octadecabacter antarcticus 307]
MIWPAKAKIVSLRDGPTSKTNTKQPPFPDRDPADEAKRLITGSLSYPREIDHFLFGGTRDWTKPLRALFAGGGTGGWLIQLAQLLTAAKRPYDITYIDRPKSLRAGRQT